MKLKRENSKLKSEKSKISSKKPRGRPPKNRISQVNMTFFGKEKQSNREKSQHSIRLEEDRSEFGKLMERSKTVQIEQKIIENFQRFWTGFVDFDGLLYFVVLALLFFFVFCFSGKRDLREICFCDVTLEPRSREGQGKRKDHRKKNKRRVKGTYW